MNKNSENNYYYKIILAYEIPYNVLDSNDPDKARARENLYQSITNIIPDSRYEKFFVKLMLFQLKDTFNYVVMFNAFFRSTVGLPMEEYVEADQLKKSVKEELESFFSSLDCDYKQLNIKTLL
jgi:hypothetical protein